jgi:hypothetical protein
MDKMDILNSFIGSYSFISHIWQNYMILGNTPLTMVTRVCHHRVLMQTITSSLQSYIYFQYNPVLICQ